jgi:hypothetical protein
MNMSLTLSEALVGFSFEINTLDGRVLSVKNSPGEDEDDDDEKDDDSSENENTSGKKKKNEKGEMTEDEYIYNYCLFLLLLFVRRKLLDDVMNIVGSEVNHYVIIDGDMKYIPNEGMTVYRKPLEKGLYNC